MAVFLVVISNCTPEGGNRLRTLTGRDLGQSVWVKIDDTNSIMYFKNPPYIDSIHAMTSIRDRYREKILLSPGTIIYERHGVGFATPWTVEEMLYQMANTGGWGRVLKKRAISIARDDIKNQELNSIRYAYTAKEGSSGVFFVFMAFFGKSRPPQSEGDQIVSGGICYPRGKTSAIELEQEGKRILMRLRFDGPKPGWIKGKS